MANWHGFYFFMYFSPSWLAIFKRWSIVCPVADKIEFQPQTEEMMTMKINEILDAIATLARSYDSYAHLLRGLALVEKYDPEGYSRIANQLEGYQFGSADDIVKLFGR